MITLRTRKVARIGLLCVVLCAALSACGGADAPLHRVAIPTATAAVPAPVAANPGATGSGAQGGGTNSPVAAAATQVPKPPPTHPPVPIQCSPPSPEPSGTPQGSDLTFSGACAFTETGRVACSTQPDDFIFQFSRKTPDGPTIYAQVNVEYYKGPGSYAQNVHFLFEIPDNGTIYEWDTLNGGATIDAGGHSGSFDNLSLPPDPGTPTQGTITVNGSFACA